MKILFVYNHPDPFILIDREILADKWDVVDWHHSGRFLNFYRLIHQIKKCDLVFGWFASWHTFFPLLVAKLIGKPTLLIIGGYDIAKIPSIGYGHQRGGIKKWISRWTMHLADHLITNSYFSQSEVESNIGIPKEKVSVIYHGVPDVIGNFPDECREPIILTVGNVERSNLLRKGHEAFVRAAKFLPEYTFVLVGAWRDDTIEYLKEIAPSNLHFPGWIEVDSLHEYYRKSSIYVQASMHEGFGMSVAEAMLAGCIPVVSRVGALPEVVGDCGIYSPSNDPSEIASSIKYSLQHSNGFREKARERILHEFPLARRIEEISNYVSKVKSG